MTTLSPVNSAAAVPLAAITADLLAPISTAPADSSTDTSAYPPEYFILHEQRATLEAEIKGLEADQWRKIGSANVSMTLASMFKLQEEAERDDAIANGEEPTPSAISSVMQTSGRAALRSAGETADLKAAKTQELSAVKAQIAEIDARMNPPVPAPAPAP